MNGKGERGEERGERREERGEVRGEKGRGKYLGGSEGRR